VSVAGFEVTYVIGGTEDDTAIERLVAAFERGGDELADFGKYLWPKLTPVFEQALAAQFSAEGEGPAGPWAPLSAQYAAWKQANYPGAPLLVRTGAMHQGLTTSTSPFSRREQQGDSYGFGTQGVTYASFHQTGTSHMPSRRPFDFGSGFETEMSRVGAQAAREAMQHAKLDDFMDLSSLEHAE
jgi:hypothetical protein